MQTYTHFLVGMLIYDLIKYLCPTWPVWLQLTTIAILVFFSHFLVDCFTMITYHTPDARWKDPFWVIYIFFVYGSSLVLLILFFTPYWWVMICSKIPDIIDWYFLRPVFKKGPVVHPIIYAIRNKLFAWIPEWNLKRKAVLIEFILIIPIIIGIWLL